jgi:hypothetical protein
MTSDQQSSVSGDPRAGPSVQQVKYLRYLLARAHERGIPYLPVEALNRGAVSAWIDYLKVFLGEESGEEGGGARRSSSSSFLCVCGLGGCAQRGAR